jgi:hypothetical protein
MAKRDFLGSNSQKSSRDTFNERAKYNNYAIPSHVIEDNPGLFRNFWFIENMYYGRIDRGHNFLVVKPEKLRPLGGQSNKAIFLLDFVAHAMSDFIEEYKKAISTSKIQKNDDFLSEILIEKGHQNIFTEYDKYMVKLRKSVHKVMSRNQAKVENFDDFVQFFIDHITTRKEQLPITFTGFVASKLSSPLSTGVFADISSLEYDKDINKITKFIDRPNFKFFMNNCLKHGFMIDYNIPWRLCANLGSGEMGKYMDLYEVNSDSVFEKYYDKTYTKDMQYFMDYMLKFYNRFVGLRPYIRREKIINNRGLQVHRFTEKRQRMTRETLERKYDDIYRTNLYVDLRNYESDDRYDDALVDNIKRTAIGHLNMTDGMGKALEYISHQFIGFLNDPYAYNGFMIREEAKKNNEQLSGQELQDLLNDSVTASRETIY